MKKHNPYTGKCEICLSSTTYQGVCLNDNCDAIKLAVDEGIRAASNNQRKNAGSFFDEPEFYIVEAFNRGYDMQISAMLMGETHY